LYLYNGNKMKIASIDIQAFRQFKNLKLDLTYPKGHEKAGEPLDKVCIIGQSGTGKTSLLKVVSETSIKIDRLDKSQTKGYSVIESENVRFIVKNKFLGNQVLNFSEYEKYDSNWGKILYDLRKHKEEELRIRVDLSKKIEHIEDFNHVQNEIDKLKEWKQNRPNPIRDLAKTFDPLLKKLNVKVKTNFEFETLEKLKYLELETLNGKPIDRTLWSSGAEQLIRKLIPLYVELPINNIILIDEPENSLYPDIQTQIVNFYSNLTTECQFIYATHSPIIASCFEPWEIVELKYNEEGYVHRELYYEGENHVDNYKIDPRYLRWDSILKKIFDLDVEGNEEERIPKLMELATLKDEIKKMQQNGSSKDELEQKLQQIEKLAKLLDVPVKLYEEAK